MILISQYVFFNCLLELSSALIFPSFLLWPLLFPIVCLAIYISLFMQRLLLQWVFEKSLDQHPSGRAYKYLIFLLKMAIVPSISVFLWLKVLCRLLAVTEWTPHPKPPQRQSDLWKQVIQAVTCLHAWMHDAFSWDKNSPLLRVDKIYFVVYFCIFGKLTWERM